MTEIGLGPLIFTQGTVKDDCNDDTDTLAEEYPLASSIDESSDFWAGGAMGILIGRKASGVPPGESSIRSR